MRTAMFPGWLAPKKKSPPEYFYEIRVSPKEKELLDAIAADLAQTKNRKRAAECMKTILAGARKMDEVLIEMPWGKLRERAEERHISDADMIWDWERE